MGDSMTSQTQDAVSHSQNMSHHARHHDVALPDRSSIWTPVSSQVLAGDSEEERAVDMLLSKDTAQRFGFANVPTPDGKSLVISWIDDQGIFAKWNREHPNDAVAEGDRIAAVNGASDEIQVMRNQFQQNTVRMLIHRRRSASCTP